MMKGWVIGIVEEEEMCAAEERHYENPLGPLLAMDALDQS
jgi:hypothetical protein